MPAGGASRTQHPSQFAACNLESSRIVPVTDRLFDLIDLIQLVLKVNSSEEKSHKRIKAKPERLRPVEVLLQRVAKCETGDQANDPRRNPKQICR